MESREGMDQFSDEYVSEEFQKATPVTYEPPRVVTKIHKVNFDVGNITTIRKLSVLVGDIKSREGTQRLDVRIPALEETRLEPVTTGGIITGGSIITGAIISRK